MSKLITLSEVREKLILGQKIDIVFCTYDQKRQTGGDREELLQVMSTNPVQLKVERKKKSDVLEQEKEKKNPNHQFNGTVNLRLQNGDIRKVHWILIEKVNGKQVVI